FWHSGCRDGDVARVTARLPSCKTAGRSPPTPSRRSSRSHMLLDKELHILEQHSRTMRLVIANLLPFYEELLQLSDGPQRVRLRALQQQVIDTAGESVELSLSALAHLRKVEGLYVANASRSVA